MLQFLLVSHKRASRWVALFCCLVSLALPVAAGDSCRAPEDAFRVEVRRVVDGDTLELADRDRVRLIGINAPETAKRKSGDHPARPAMPLGNEAKTMLEQMVASSGRQLLVRKGVQSRDRYGRMLAHAYLSKGTSVEAALLSEGFGFHVVMPPNLAMIECLAKAEEKARFARAGVWGLAYYRPRDESEVAESDLGFQRVRMHVSRTELKSRSWWLLGNGRVSVQISHGDQKNFDKQLLAGLTGKTVVVRGWLVQRNLSDSQARKGYKPFVFNIGHPAMIEVAGASP